MIKRILIEGPDCSGKSTALDRIKNALRWDAKSLHHREGDQFQRYMKEYCSAENIVFDRGHFSEAVYGQMWRGGNPFSKEEFNFLNFYLQREGLVIFALPLEETLIGRYRARKFSQQIKENELSLARNLFLEKSKLLPHMLYTSSSYDELDYLVAEVVRRVNG
jgi:thymidylate kinase